MTQSSSEYSVITDKEKNKTQKKTEPQHLFIVIKAYIVRPLSVSILQRKRVEDAEIGSDTPGRGNWSEN